jgi:VCBS repeat-containing protein
MMIDNALAVSISQAVTATGNSTDYIDVTAALNLGAGEIPKAILQVSAVSGTSPTLTVKLVGADDSGFSTNKVTIGAIVDNITAAGLYRIPIGNVARKRYYRLEYTVGGTTPSFTCTLCIAKDDQAIQTP